MKSFAKKWGLEESSVYTIYVFIQQSGVKYGKTSRALKSFNIELSTRQLKYFYKKVRLYERYDISQKGKPKNYSNLLRRKT